ncbi:hypothetical protein SAY87_029986 [Trapa incisa]|uniref:Malectin-like domain-containing protein n=1 Tax=Trapa incisa TaxID=236973 RepID=A0AAN7K984_9MYRT|nr:hypothetical protein SAY87_029986 [Trapa incisa]
MRRKHKSLGRAFGPSCRSHLQIDERIPDSYIVRILFYLRIIAIAKGILLFPLGWFIDMQQQQPSVAARCSIFLSSGGGILAGRTEDMSALLFLLWLVSISFLSVNSLPAPRGFLISCGASNSTASGDLTYVPDDEFTEVGNKTTISASNVMPILRDLRFFPDKSAKKYCYAVPVVKGSKYLVRTSYYYGGFDGGTTPPIFDQIIDGTMWGTVDTTEDYSNGLASYYELVVAAMGKYMSVCLARNSATVSDPFISLLEVEYLDDSVYNSTDFKNYALGLVSRATFGNNNYTISYPEDQYNRLWHPFKDDNPAVESKSSVKMSSFWNMPPAKAFSTAITTSRGKTLKVQWPRGSLPESLYYVSLYFQDTRTESPYSWRVFDILVNGKKFYSDLNVTAHGVIVFAAQWPLSGQTKIEMTPKDGIPVGPLINAGEVFQLLPLGGRTLTRDVMVMDDLAQTLDKLPSDWYGDPCLPKDHSWTGVTCSNGKLARIIAMNFTGMGLSGSLPSSLGNLTAMTHLWLGDNKLFGKIPDMGTMKGLTTLHLENNQFEGPVPNWLGKLPRIQEIFLQNNKLTGGIPKNLQNRTGLNIQVLPFGHGSHHHHNLNAPTSPTGSSHLDNFFCETNWSKQKSISSVPFNGEQKPGVPKHRATQGADDDVTKDDFKFEFSGQLDMRVSASADELFDCGKIRPLKLPPRLQVGFGANESVSSNTSPRTPTIRFSPMKKPAQSKDFDPISKALEETRKTEPSDEHTIKHNSPPVSHLSNLSSVSSSKGYREWSLKDFLLFQSAQEGRGTGQNPLRKNPTLLSKLAIATAAEDDKNCSFWSIDSASFSRQSKLSLPAHKFHYT